MTRFSDYFKIKKPQSELDFVDIPLNTDIPLYLDAYALSIGKSEWFKKSNQMLVDYFDTIVKSIKNGDTKSALNYLNNLHEPNETHFGLSQKNPRGKGVGFTGSGSIYESLKKSRAVELGLISEISDCELMIHGFGPDIISDIITNIIKENLIQFTNEQCTLHHVPTRKVSVTVWNYEERRIESTYVELPIYEGKPLILVPLKSARYYPTYDNSVYYENFCLDYLRVEHWNARDSLVRTFKNGTPRDVPTKWLKERYPINDKEFLVTFSKNHPDILQKYKASAQKKSGITVDQTEMAQREAQNISLKKLGKKLEKIKEGKDEAQSFEEVIAKILLGLFGDVLRNQKVQHRKNQGRQRVDVTFENFDCGNDFFSELLNRRKIHAPHILFECKNYSKDIAGNEFDQIKGRLGSDVGHFGIIVCRKNDDKKNVLQRCRDAFNKDRKHIIVLEDSDIKKLISLCIKEGSIQNRLMDSFLDEKLDEVIQN